MVQFHLALGQWFAIEHLFLSVKYLIEIFYFKYAQVRAFQQNKSIANNIIIY